MSQVTVQAPPGNSQQRPQAPLAPPAPPRRRRRFLLLIVPLVVVALLAIAIPYYLHSLAWQSTDDAFIDGHIIQVSPRVAGHVSYVYVDDNQQVSAGQLLAQLDPADYQARLEQGQAAVQEARSRVAQAQATVEAAQALVQQTRAEVNAAEAEENRTAVELHRIQELARSGSASPVELNNAEAAHRSAVAQLDAARKRVIAAEAQVAQGRAAIETAQADVTRAQANLRQDELNLSYTKISAPQSGRVTRKAVEPGQYVQTGQVLLAVVPEEFWVTANYKETQLTNMRPGQPAEVKIDAYPDLTLAGRVDSIQSGTGARFSLLPPENATGNYVKVVQRVPVKITFDTPPDATRYPLGPGMSVVPDVKVK